MAGALAGEGQVELLDRDRVGGDGVEALLCLRLIRRRVQDWKIARGVLGRLIDEGEKRPGGLLFGLVKPKAEPGAANDNRSIAVQSGEQPDDVLWLKRYLIPLVRFLARRAAAAGFEKAVNDNSRSERRPPGE